MYSEDPARARLAEQAACGVPVLPQLRMVCLAEALTAPSPGHTLDLNAELEALCTALQESVRRRPGWLYFVPTAHPAPAALPRKLLHAALLCWVSGVLSDPDGHAVLQLEATAHAAILVLRGGTGWRLPADTRALLLRLAAVCGGAVVQSGGNGPFTAALRLPLNPALPCRQPSAAADLLCDRYSVLQIFLSGFCAAPNE